MTEHTPGPWVWQGESNDLVNPDAYAHWHAAVKARGAEAMGESRPFVLHAVWCNDDTADLDCDNPADASLIAAAPDLLAACRAALNDRMYKDWPAVADLLIAAIAKAGGSLS